MGPNWVVQASLSPSDQGGGVSTACTEMWVKSALGRRDRSLSGGNDDRPAFFGACVCVSVCVRVCAYDCLSVQGRDESNRPRSGAHAKWCMEAVPGRITASGLWVARLTSAWWAA